MKRLWMFAWVWCAWGCGEEFAPETLVSTLRVLGVKAEPASLRPGESAQLSSLVLDPSRPGKPNTVLWLACEPDPLNLGRTACSNAAQLSDPSLLGGSGAELPEGMRLIGLNASAAYSVGPDLFAQLAPEDRQRQVGTVGQVLGLVVGAEPNLAPGGMEALFEKVRNKEVASVLTLFRIQVSESPARNANPTVTGLWVNGERLPDGWTLRVKPQEALGLAVEVAESAFETFVAHLPGGDEEQTEKIISAWYSTTGRFSETRVALNSETAQTFTAPGDDKDPIPADRTGTLYTVLRDTRGGQGWSQFPLYVCDESLGAPTVTDMQPGTGPAGGSTSLVLRGLNLESVLEVTVGGQVLRQGVYSATTNTYEGLAPALPPGEHPVVIRGKHCADVPTALVYQVTTP